jgi:hypothetical protein
MRVWTTICLGWPATAQPPKEPGLWVLATGAQLFFFKLRRKNWEESLI